VIADVVHALDPAVDPGQRIVEQGQARGLWPWASSANLSSAREAKRRHRSSWSAPSTLTQNRPVAAMRGHEDERLSGKKPTSGGSSEIEVNEPTTRPVRAPGHQLT
jgi:hypothetical protein